MSRDGSGNYSLPAGNPVSAGTVISSTTHNTTNNDIASALTQSIAKDGQTVPTANLPMGGFRHTNVANGSLANDYATLGQAQSNVQGYVVDTSGAANTITIAPSPATTAYATGQTWRVKLATTNTGATTITVNGLASKNVLRQGAAALAPRDLVSGEIVYLTYDGTQFILQRVVNDSVLILDREATPVVVQNTTTETVIASHSIPARSMSTDKTVSWNIRGNLGNTSGGGAAPILRVKFGGTTIYQDTVNVPSNANNRAWSLEFSIQNNAATNAQQGNGVWMISEAANPTTGIGSANVNNTTTSVIAAALAGLTVDTTAAVTFEVTWQWDTATVAKALRRNLATCTLS